LSIHPREITLNKLIPAVAAVVLLHIPSIAMSQCGDGNCAVGAAGTGGEKSAGKAQGSHEVIPSIRFPGRTITNSGNSDAGRLSIVENGNSLGTISGTFRQNPEPAARGRGTGLFGDWSGQCAEELLFDDC